MTGSGPYSDLFKQAKEKLDQENAALQAKRDEINAKDEAEKKADKEVLENIVLPELRAANDQLKPDGYRVEIISGFDGVIFRVRSNNEWGRASYFYSVALVRGSASLARSHALDQFRRLKDPVEKVLPVTTLKRENINKDMITKVLATAIDECLRSQPVSLGK